MTLFIILVINLLPVFFIKSDKKYWAFSIPLWIILFASFFIFRFSSDPKIARLKHEYRESTDSNGYGDYDKRTKLAISEVTAQKTNSLILSLLGYQTIITFFLQLLGKNDTSLNIYKWTMGIFAILSVLTILLAIMMGITPSTGFVT